MKRQAMVEAQLAQRGITDEKVLWAMGAVPRHEFVPDDYQNEAYGDWPLPIGENQTISQPYIVAYMTAALRIKRKSKVLEIGTGSGYQAAVLAEMGAEVYSIEIIPRLATRAAALLLRLGYAVQTKIGDGTDGWKENAPFDAIIVTAAPKTIPPSLKDQLREGGRLAVPLGGEKQILEVYIKKKSGLEPTNSLPVRFVPMTGKIDQL